MGKEKIKQFRLKKCFQELKKLIVLRAKRLKFEEKLRIKEMKAKFNGFK